MCACSRRFNVNAIGLFLLCAKSHSLSYTLMVQSHWAMEEATDTHLIWQAVNMLQHSGQTKNAGCKLAKEAVLRRVITSLLLRHVLKAMLLPK